MKNILLILFVCAGNYGLSQSTSNWFPFQPKYEAKNGVLDMSDWLDAPAGKHGFLQIDDERLVFEDGTPVKLWGTNICSAIPYVDNSEADKFVEFLSIYGNNAVRFHKFTRHACHEDKSTVLDPEKFKRFDYFQSKLKEKGMYYGWSHIYGHKVLPGDSTRLVSYEEIRNLKYPWAHLNGSTSSLVNFAEDLQDLNIELTVNMLNHINPYSGLRYADDPALAFIEFQNEDDIFWSAIQRSLEQAPIYRAMLCQQFSDWLKNKYQTQQKLREAWGANNIPQGQSIGERNLFPDPDHGLFSRAYEQSIKEGQPIHRHIADKMTFLYETQLKFYKKFEKAIRDTGYRGVLIGSCWQAGSGIAHYYNLHTDYEIGMIDRHNYFGGGAGGHRLDVGNVKNKSLLTGPGSGLLSAGSQQVIDRPFAFSEWMSLVPNEWTAEAAPLIALYGMGLQGWDASFSFATDIPRFSRFLESERHGVYNATSPLHMGLYPALARMVYRGDIKESHVMGARNVHIPSLAEGKLGFEELVRQEHDVKTFTGTISSEYLAIGRFPSRFTEQYEETVIPDVSDYWNKKEKVITSSTDQLKWHYDDNQYVTVNTDASKGVIGFAGNENVALDDWEITTSNRFAVILITSLSRSKDLTEAKNILITAVARGRNTGMEYKYEDGKTLLSKKGTNPLLLEPVEAKIKVSNLENFVVEVLDHDGLSTGEMLKVEEGTFTIGASKYKTLYYLLSKK